VIQMRPPQEVVLTERMLNERRLCNNCLGRQFPNFQPQLAIKEKGILLRFLAETKTKGWNSEGYTWEELYNLFEKQPCELCRGIFDKIDDIAGRLADEMREYEFKNFLCGANVPFQITEKEDKIRSKYKLKGESLRKEIVREVGLKLNELLKRDTSFSDPDIKIVFQPFEDQLNVKITTKPIFMRGQYETENDLNIKERLKEFFLGEFQAESVKVKISPSHNPLVKRNSFTIRIIHPKKRTIHVEKIIISGGIEVTEIKEMVV
jgi:tRNA U54 and U55 pseudouridine synthase Pus10